MSAATASRSWPGQNPIGQRFRLTAEPNRLIEVIGIVGDVRGMSLESDPSLAVYLPYWQGFFNNMSFAIKTSADPAAMASAVRGAISEIDGDIPVHAVRTMDDVVDASVARRRFEAALLMLFAAVAMTLAGVGIYGVLSYAVIQRTKEIGVRLALGASRGSLQRMVVRDALWLVLAGLALGSADRGDGRIHPPHSPLRRRSSESRGPSGRMRDAHDRRHGGRVPASETCGASQSTGRLENGIGVPCSSNVHRHCRPSRIQPSLPANTPLMSTRGIEKSFPVGPGQTLRAPPHHARHQAGRVRVDHGAVRRRQVDAAPHPRHARRRLDRRVRLHGTADSRARARRSARRSRSATSASSSRAITCSTT